METIMIQEADKATRDVVSTALEMEGYLVCSLDDPENAGDLIRRLRPKLVLLDCWLRNYSGKQLIQWIKAHFPALPLVALSCDNRIEEKYLQLGFDDYIKKPFDLDLLYQVVRRQLDQHLEPSPEIRTEGPPSEKDQQGRAAEGTRKSGIQALVNWRRLKQKPKKP